MNYKSYLETILTADVITDELNYNYTGTGMTVIIKQLVGINYRDSTVIPIQLDIHTDDVPATLTIMQAFTKAYSNTSFTQGFDTYVHQIYSTPMVTNNYQPAGINYTSLIIVSGTLVVSNSISDIKKVVIDGEELETNNRNLLYSIQLDNQQTSGEYINNSVPYLATISFSFSTINKNYEFFNKLRRIRKGLENNSFEIILTFTDNDVEETYTMYLESQSLVSENSALPNMTVVMRK